MFSFTCTKLINWSVFFGSVGSGFSDLSDQDFRIRRIRVIGWSETLLVDQKHYWWIRNFIGGSETVLVDQIRNSIGGSETLLVDQKLYYWIRNFSDSSDFWFTGFGWVSNTRCVKFLCILLLSDRSDKFRIWLLACRIVGFLLLDFGLNWFRRRSQNKSDWIYNGQRPVFIVICVWIWHHSPTSFLWA